MKRLFFMLLTVPAVVFGQEAVFSVGQAGWARFPDPGGEEGLVAVEVRLQEGWHVNPPHPSDPFLIATRLTLALPPGWVAGEPEFPKPRKVTLKVFDAPVELLEGTFWVRIPIKVPVGAGGVALQGVLEAQACNNVSCLPPREVQFSVPWSPVRVPEPAPEVQTAEAPVTSGRMLASKFAGASLLLQLLLAFLGGLALNLTPCVYPIIPVTVGFFLNQAASTKRTAMLAGFYVLGMAMTYSSLGVLAALTGKMFGAALQSPWVTAVIVAVVLLLAASMFGLWEIRVPASVSQLAGGRQGVLGATVMGLVVGLVAAPCIGPFVLGLLAYVGQKQSVPLGFLLFFTLALGLGLPYLFLAISTRSIEKLPHSGAWMLGVRQLFGVLLVALAFYFARPLLPATLGSRLFALSLLLGGFYLAVIARPGADIPLVDRFMRVATLGLVLAGALLWPQEQAAANRELSWEKADAQVLGEAIAAGGPVVVDFYADWCLPCKELDEKTFSHPEVQAALARFRRLKVDLTRVTEATEKLRKAYGIAGVPTVLFFHQGREVTNLRLSGFEEPSAFLLRIQTLVAGTPSGG